MGRTTRRRRLGLNADCLELALDILETCVHGGHDLLQLIEIVGATDPAIALSPSHGGLALDHTDSVMSGPVRVLGLLHGAYPFAILLGRDGLEMVQHGARINVDHPCVLAHSDGGKHQMDLATAGSLRRLVVGQDAIVDLEPALGPTYCRKSNAEREMLFC